MPKFKSNVGLPPGVSQRKPHTNKPKQNIPVYYSERYGKPILAKDKIMNQQEEIKKLKIENENLKNKIKELEKLSGKI